MRGPNENNISGSVQNRNIRTVLANTMINICDDHLETFRLRISQKDTIPTFLWQKLKLIGFPDQLVRILVFIYSITYVYIRTATGLTKPIKVKKGVLQGESLSPYLFNLYINDIEKVFDNMESTGIRVNNTRTVHILMYADDMAVVTSDPISLQRKINKLGSYFDSNELSVNLNKTQVVVFRNGGKLSKDDSFYWNKYKIQVVKSYTYLGIVMTSSGHFRDASENRIKKGLAAVYAFLH